MEPDASSEGKKRVGRVSAVDTLEDVQSDDSKKREKRTEPVEQRNIQVVGRRCELEALREQNRELQEESQELLKTVIDLHLKVEAKRKRERSALETENKLLRLELQEHRRIIAEIRELSGGGIQALHIGGNATQECQSCMESLSVSSRFGKQGLRRTDAFHA